MGLFWGFEDMMFSRGVVEEEQVGDDLQRIADELTRIEREYGGAVDLIVVRDHGFMQVDVNNVRPLLFGPQLGPSFAYFF